ncbi:MAG TPA: hypothetical protein VN698_00165 [Bacteroidia bacterium]|nr:hypothetical protein [Bacteroidia bacterium]
MSKRGKILLIVTCSIILMLILLSWYREYSINNDKKIVLTQLEIYKSSHFMYPAEIDELNIDTKIKFSYFPDSIRQSFSLGYSSGIMDANHNSYDSKTKKWTQIFNY